MSKLLRRLDEVRLWPYRAFVRRRMERTVLEHMGSHCFVVLPQVFNPSVFRSSRCLAECVAGYRAASGAQRRLTALDMGTGSGVQAVVLADCGFDVTAVDINPRAVLCARINAALNGVEEIDVLQGDLFDPVGGRTFDLVVFNPPFFMGEATSDFERAWRSNDVVERFARALPGALTAGGKALIVWSSYADDDALLGRLRRASLEARPVRSRRVGAETFTVYEARCSE
jgi:HemK-related putative methylase